MAAEKMTDRECREAIIRLAVRDFAELHLSQGATLDRLTEDSTLDDATEAITHWTGIHPAAIRGGQAIIFDEAQQIQHELSTT